jgi:periplasmic protein TonB
MTRNADAPRRLSARRIALLAIGLALAAAAIWGLHQQREGSQGGHQASASGGDSDGVNLLLGLAGTAIAEHRLVAPEGANAFEFYLSVLQLDPSNAAARARLADLFPQASAEVEAAINAKALDEATRELRLLREVDSDNYTLSLLAGKLDAQRMIKVHEDEARAAVIQARMAEAHTP